MTGAAIFQIFLQSPIILVYFVGAFLALFIIRKLVHL